MLFLLIARFYYVHPVNKAFLLFTRLFRGLASIGTFASSQVIATHLLKLHLDESQNQKLLIQIALPITRKSIYITKKKTKEKIITVDNRTKGNRKDKQKRKRKRYIQLYLLALIPTKYYDIRNHFNSGYQIESSFTIHNKIKFAHTIFKFSKRNRERIRHASSLTYEICQREM